MKPIGDTTLSPSPLRTSDPTSSVSDCSTATAGKGRVSLKKRTIAGLIWTGSSFGASQALRLLSNLILCRLLFKEAFGLMTLTSIFVEGLVLCSDLGIGPCIIQHKRGDDSRFLNTVWTIQVIRGGILFAVGCLIAWPLAYLYSQPQIIFLLPATALGALISGFNSTAVFTLNRHLNFKAVSIINLVSQVIGTVCTVVIAVLLQSVWALIIGSLVNQTITMVLSHVALREQRNRFDWEPEAVKQLISFGRWIFFSTVLSFSVRNLDRLILGFLLPIGDLGVYSIALMFASTILETPRSISAQVLLPALSEIVRENPSKLYTHFRRIRCYLVLPTVALLVFLGCFADDVIRYLYKPAFHDAGWMLQMLAIGSIAGIVNNSAGLIWLPLGNVKVVVFLQIYQLIVTIIAMFIGNHIAGLYGLVLGVAAVQFVNYPFNTLFLARVKLWQPELDIPILLLLMISSAALFF